MSQHFNRSPGRRNLLALIVALGLVGANVVMPDLAWADRWGEDWNAHAGTPVEALGAHSASRDEPAIVTMAAPSAQALTDAEALYKSQRFHEALDAFRAIASRPDAPAFGWFRLGNLLQRQGDWDHAASVYRRVLMHDDAGDLRGKALFNLAIVQFELARLALAQFERERDQGSHGAQLGSASGDGPDLRAVHLLKSQIGADYASMQGAATQESMTRRERAHPAADAHDAARSRRPGNGHARAQVAQTRRAASNKEVNGPIDIHLGGMGR